MYSSEQKALAVAIIHRHGGMTTDALADVRAVLGKSISTSTLQGWLSANLKSETENRKTEKAKPKKKDATPGAVVTPDVQEAAEKTLDSLFEEIVRAYLQHALKTEVLREVRGKDAVIAAAAALDKLRLIQGLPTEIVAVLPVMMSRLAALGISPAMYFNEMMAELDRAYRERTG